MFRIKHSLALLSVFSVFLFSCKKDYEENKVPVVDAGASQSTTLPGDSVRLTGTATDKDGHVVAYLWSQISGPFTSTIQNPGSASTMVKGLIAGNYVFQLMATDEQGATGVDTVSVNVKPALEQTLTLAPVNNPTEVTFGAAAGQSIAFISDQDLPVTTWTRNGDAFVTRILLKFDLSAIPASANILSANLFLYSYPAPTLNGNFIDANFGSNNTLLVQQIVSNWSFPAVNWASPPATAIANQVTAPHTTQSQLDLNLNVKALVSSMVSTNANYGFMLRLQNETVYTCRQFVSSHSTTHTTKIPKLVLVYN